MLDLCICHRSNQILIIVLCVDDLILTGSSTSQIKELKLRLQGSFEMTDHGMHHYFLGVQVIQSTFVISL